MGRDPRKPRVGAQADPAAKAALENFTMTAGRKLGPAGITANVVHPPATDTGWLTPVTMRPYERRARSATSGAPRRRPR